MPTEPIAAKGHGEAERKHREEYRTRDRSFLEAPKKPARHQTGQFFLPLNFMIGWKPTEHTVISAEFGIPIIKEFPVYTFKTQVRIGYLF